MTINTGFDALLIKTITSTVDDIDGPDLATSTRFLDQGALSRVMIETGRSADRYNNAIATCEEQMRAWIRAAADNNKDMVMFGYARAALRLKELVEAPRGGGWLSDGAGGFRRAG